MEDHISVQGTFTFSGVLLEGTCRVEDSLCTKRGTTKQIYIYIYIYIDNHIG